MNRGRLIAFEGIDGCGKSTQLARLAANLRGSGYEVVETCEPTRGPTGRRIRDMARSGRELAPAEELRWFVEDRRVHVAESIEPALGRGCLVLTDRYYLSTVAYQGARGLDAQQILTDSEAEFPVPDLVVLLRISPECALERVHERGEVIEAVFERRDFQERVAALFGEIDRPYIERVAADAEPDEVEALVAARVRVRLDLAF